jgi:hypothetical protein
VESQDDRTPEEKLRLLRRIVLEDEGDQPQLEASIRSWAAHDTQARHTLERVDATRIDYLRTLWEAISGDAEQALPMARLLYVVLIGSQHVLPQLEPKDIDRMYDIVLGPVMKEQS